jgi:hypothetical protein
MIADEGDEHRLELLQIWPINSLDRPRRGGQPALELRQTASHRSKYSVSLTTWIINLEKIMISKLIKKLSTFYQNRRFIVHCPTSAEAGTLPYAEINKSILRPETLLL